MCSVYSVCVLNLYVTPSQSQQDQQIYEHFKVGNTLRGSQCFQALISRGRPHTSPPSHGLVTMLKGNRTSSSKNVKYADYTFHSIFLSGTIMLVH